MTETNTSNYNPDISQDEINLLINQIRCILLGKPLLQQKVNPASNLSDLEDAIYYLAGTIEETNDLLKNLSMGNLSVTPPSRQNIMSGYLKELQSILEHLTWQANQVADGDYSQSSSFLGDFSISFNRMIKQLDERESQLKNHSYVLEDITSMGMAVLNEISEYVVILNNETKSVIFENVSSAKTFHFSSVDKNNINNPMFKYIFEYDGPDSEVRDFKCVNLGDNDYTIYRIKSYKVDQEQTCWDVHLLLDVTDEEEYIRHIEDVAYVDELTGVNNRRACLKDVKKMLEKHEAFTFCMIDLDELKYINDNFGHNCGDKYLIATIEHIKSTLRDNDKIYRLGGDEFAIVIRRCSKDAMREKMEKADRLLADENLCPNENDFKASFSYGIVQVNPDNTKDLPAIIDEADRYMYHQKCEKKKVKLYKEKAI